MAQVKSIYYAMQNHNTKARKGKDLAVVVRFKTTPSIQMWKYICTGNPQKCKTWKIENIFLVFHKSGWNELQSSGFLHGLMDIET